MVDVVVWTLSSCLRGWGFESHYVQTLKHYAYMYFILYNIRICVRIIHVFRTYPYIYGIRIKIHWYQWYHRFANWRTATEPSIALWLGSASQTSRYRKYWYQSHLGSVGFRLVGLDGTKLPPLGFCHCDSDLCFIVLLYMTNIMYVFLIV